MLFHLSFIPATLIHGGRCQPIYDPIFASMTDIERKMRHFEANAAKCKKHKEKPTIGFDGVHVIECGKGCVVYDGENAAIEPVMQKWEDLNR